MKLKYSYELEDGKEKLSHLPKAEGVEPTLCVGFFISRRGGCVFLFNPFIFSLQRRTDMHSFQKASYRRLSDIQKKHSSHPAELKPEKKPHLKSSNVFTFFDSKTKSQEEEIKRLERRMRHDRVRQKKLEEDASCTNLLAQLFCCRL